VLQLTNEAATNIHKIFTLFKLTSYLQYHPEYKKPATRFHAILDSLFFTKNNSGLTVSGKPHHRWWWEWWEGKGMLNKINWEGVRVK